MPSRTPGARVAFLVLVAGALVVPATAQAQQPPASAPAETAVVARLASAVDSLVAIGEFSGVVVLARGGTPILQAGHGFADSSARREIDIGTAFNLGSINKMFTSVAIRQLVNDGRIHLDSTIATYWPDYPNPDVARRVTIRQLLEHRSGIGGNIFASPPGGMRADLRHNHDMVALFASEPLQFEPGTAERYSNAGYVVLGEIVARVSGEDYYDYVQRHIYDPAGMARSGHFAVDSLPPNTAIGYTRGRQDAPPGSPLAPNTSFLPGRGSAAGGGYSTAGDLLKFVAAGRDGRVKGVRSGGFGAAGGAPGINALLETGLPGGYDLVVLANLDPPAAERVGRILRGILGLQTQER